MADEFPIGEVCTDTRCPFEGVHRHDKRDGSIWRQTAQATGRLEKIGENEYRIVGSGA